jgi:hypothetical protein
MRGMTVRARCRSKSWLIDFGMHRATGRAREDRVTEPDGAAIASLLPKPATEDLLRLWIQIDAAAAGACLDGDLD